ncbi:MAG: DUF1351 domain-containing protein [Ruminococcus sp.]|nr:DUF1351 domain-containing protein [Ruminococcus sp.]
MSMELVLSPATVEITQGIKNKDYLKKELASQLEYYKGLAVTEETMKDAKSDRATLNKLRTAIDDQRKKVKKQFTEMYKPFEDDCKELIAMIDEPIGAIDSQMDVLNEKRKAEKYAELEKYFTLLQPPAFVRIESVLDPKWGNATAKLDKLKENMAAAVQQIVDDLAEVRKLYADSPMLTAIMQRFEQTLDKGAALAYAAEIERREQQRREREAAKNARESQPKPEPILVEKSFTPPEETVIHTTVQPEPTITGTFRVKGTKAQLIALREFLKANGLDFEIIR